jgi:drug/metabolite transporter (DMT)-like permease
LKPTSLGRLAAAGAIVLWGVSFVATKAALKEISPVTLIFTRFRSAALAVSHSRGEEGALDSAGRYFAGSRPTRLRRHFCFKNGLNIDSLWGPIYHPQKISSGT